MSEPIKPNPVPTPAAKPAISNAEQLLALLTEVQDKQKLQAKQIEAAQKAAEASKAAQKPVEPKAATVDDIDWTKISEKDVFDLSIDIPAIEQTMPSYLDIHLKDKNFVPRWVSTLKERLGPMRQAGFDYVTKADLDTDYPCPLEPDAAGHFTFVDVVALKVPKARYYPALRKNHLKSAQIHGANAVKSKINSQISNSPAVENAFRRGALSVYEDETKEDVAFKEDLSNITL